jgi:hypothetical protein
MQHTKSTPSREVVDGGCPNWNRHETRGVHGADLRLLDDWHHQSLAKVYQLGTLEHLRLLCGKTVHLQRVSGQEITCFLGPVMSFM